jgi:hypothetical protein
MLSHQVLGDNIGGLDLVDKSLVSQREFKLISVTDASVILLHWTPETYIGTNIADLKLRSSLGSSTKSQTLMLLDIWQNVYSKQ